MSVNRNMYLLSKDVNPATEPALTVGGGTATVAGVLSLALYFFPDIPNSVIQTLLVISAFGLPIITALFTRGKAWSPASVQEVVDEAVRRALEQANKAKPAIRDEFPPDVR